MAAEQEYIVTYKIKATRGGYRSEGETTVTATSEQKASDKAIDKLFEHGVIDYPSAVEIVGVQVKRAGE